MNALFKEIVEKMSYISSSQTSEDGYPIFQFQISQKNLGDLAQYGTWYTPMFTKKYEPPKFIIEDFVFYSNDEKFIDHFQSLIADRIENKENSEKKIN